MQRHAIGGGACPSSGRNSRKTPSLKTLMHTKPPSGKQDPITPKPLNNLGPSCVEQAFLNGGSLPGAPWDEDEEEEKVPAKAGEGFSRKGGKRGFRAQRYGNLFFALRTSGSSPRSPPPSSLGVCFRVSGSGFTSKAVQPLMTALVSTSGALQNPSINPQKPELAPKTLNPKP